MAHFTKGDTVCWVADWDRKGTVRIVEAIVYSCGKKQMVLTSAATGKELGRNYSPTPEQNCFSVITLENDRTKVEALALEIAEKIIAYQNAHYERCLAGDHEEGYTRMIRKSHAELHAPDFFWGELPANWGN